VLHLRRPRGRAGAIVAAIDPATNRSAWELELAVPPAGPPAADDSPLRLTAVAASGAAYVLDGAAMSRGRQDAALRSQPLVGGEAPLTTSVDLGGGRLAAAAAKDGRLLLVRPQESRQNTQWVDLPAPLAGSLAAWQGGVVFPTAAGQVFFVNVESAAVDGSPFQPELRPGREFNWLPAATVGEGDQAQLFISDGIESLYRVERVAAPTPHLAAVRRVDVSAAPLATPLAIVGNRVIAGTGDGRLAAFDVQELTPAELVELGGRAIWGPYADGEGALLATDAGELIRIGADGEIAWRRDLAHGELAGQPLVDGAAALLLHTQGGLSQINLADGAETGFVEFGQPAVAGPVRLGPRVVVTAPDGTLVVVNRP
jgi:hypothetical protein